MAFFEFEWPKLMPEDSEAIRRHWMNSSHCDECPAIDGDIFTDSECLCGYDQFEKALLRVNLIGQEDLDYKCGEDVPEPEGWWTPDYEKD